MALSKLAISLIAGIGSVVAVGGITAGVVVSNNNRNTASIVEKESVSKEDKKPSIDENRSIKNTETNKEATSSTSEKASDKQVSTEETTKAKTPETVEHKEETVSKKEQLSGGQMAMKMKEDGSSQVHSIQDTGESPMAKQNDEKQQMDQEQIKAAQEELEQPVEQKPDDKKKALPSDTDSRLKENEDELSTADSNASDASPEKAVSVEETGKSKAA